MAAARAHGTLGRGRRRARPAARQRAERGDAARLPRCGRRARGTPRPGGRGIPGRAAPLALASGEPQRIVPMAAVVAPWLAVSGDREALRSLIDKVLDDARRRLAEHARQRSDRARARRGRRDRPARADDRVDAQVERPRREDADRPARGRRAPRARRRPRGGRGQAADRGRRARTQPRSHLRRGVPRARPGARVRGRGRRGRRAREARARANAVLQPLGVVNAF